MRDPNRGEAERRFWDSLKTQSGFEVCLATADEKDPLDVYVYLVDTGSPWVAAFVMSQAAIVDIKCMLRAGHSAHEGAAMVARSIQQASVMGARTFRTVQVATCGSAAEYICLSPLWTQVSREYGEVSGHWVAMLYRMANGDVAMQLAFDRIDAFDPGFITKDMLRELVSGFIERDNDGDGGLVSQRIKAAGGLISHSYWR